MYVAAMKRLNQRGQESKTRNLLLILLYFYLNKVTKIKPKMTV